MKKINKKCKKLKKRILKFKRKLSNKKLARKKLKK